MLNQRDLALMLGLMSSGHGLERVDFAVVSLADVHTVVMTIRVTGGIDLVLSCHPSPSQVDAEMQATLMAESLNAHMNRNGLSWSLKPAGMTTDRVEPAVPPCPRP